MVMVVVMVASHHAVHAGVHGGCVELVMVTTTPYSTVGHGCQRCHRGGRDWVQHLESLHTMVVMTHLQQLTANIRRFIQLALYDLNTIQVPKV